jgi:hypothetical protein
MSEITAEQVPARITMRQACEILGISKSTCKRRIREGQYGKGESSGQQTAVGQNTRTFSHSDFHLPEGATPAVDEPDPVVEPELPYQDDLDAIAPIVHKAPAPAPEPQDNSFAAKFLRGEETDSSGNDVHGHNRNFSSPVSLLGPVVDAGHVEPIPDTQAHMNQGLIETAALHASVKVVPDVEHRTRSGQVLAPGYSQEAYQASLRAWDKTHHGPENLSMGEQREQVERSKKMIRSAFPEAERP